MKKSFFSALLVLASLFCGCDSKPVSAQVSKQFFGMGQNYINHPAISVPYGTLRLWDSGTSWSQINTSNGVYDFSVLDKWLARAKAQNVDVIYAFGRTPRWASSNSTDGTCSYEPGSCYAPKSMGIAYSFASALAKHVQSWNAANGAKVSVYYELWNEPNASTWKDSMTNLVQMTKQFTSAIKAVNANNVVLTPCPQGRSSYTWMDTYLSAGGVGDIVTFHPYLGGTPPYMPDNSIYGYTPLVQGFRSVLAKHNMSTKHLWATEAAWSYGPDSALCNVNTEAQFVARAYLMAAAENVYRLAWYQWDNTQNGTMWSATATQTPCAYSAGVHPDGVAFQNVRTWLLGKKVSLSVSGNVLTLKLTDPSGATEYVIWRNDTQWTSIPTPVGMKYYTSMFGNQYTAGMTTSIGPSPIFFSASSAITASTPPSTPTESGTASSGGTSSTQPSSAPTMPFVPTTTLATETGNNTSASASFVAQSDGNAAGSSNVSKANVADLLYPGSPAKVFAHLMVWFGKSSHMNVGYNSTDPAQVHKQLDDMQSRGFAGTIIDWYGPGNSQDQATLAVKADAEKRSNFQFAVVVDKGALKSSTDPTSTLISLLKYAADTYESSPAYLKVNGQPVVFEFGLEKLTIDWTKVKANAPNNPLIIWETSYTMPDDAGAFGWPQPKVGPVASYWGQSSVDYFYQGAKAHPSQMTFGTAYKGFDDSLASWGSKRLLYQNQGQTWLDTFSEAKKYYTSASSLPSFQAATWNDYEEGTEIETGIENGVSLSVTISGAIVNWTVNTGNLKTLDHFTVFVSQDGVNLMTVGNLASTIYSFDLSKCGLPHGVYKVLVKAQAKSSIVNHVSTSVSAVL